MDFPAEKGSFKVKSTNKVASKLYISIAGENADAEINGANIIVALYEKGTGKLVSAHIPYVWDTKNCQILNTTLELSGMKDYSADLYDVKVMAIGDNLTPIGEAASF